jgi:hypothetical protein
MPPRMLLQTERDGDEKHPHGVPDGHEDSLQINAPTYCSTRASRKESVERPGCAYLGEIHANKNIYPLITQRHTKKPLPWALREHFKGSKERTRRLATSYKASKRSKAGTLR